MRFSRSAVFLPAILISWPLQSSATTRYYTATIRSGSDAIYGYAQFDESSDGGITGKICTYEDVSDVLSFKAPEILGTLSVEGKTRERKMSLTLRSDAKEAARKEVSAVLRTGSFVLSPTNPKSEQDTTGDILGRGPGWQGPDSADTSYLRLNEISEVVNLDRHAQLEGPKFDGMTPEQALSFVAGNQWDEVITPTVVRFVYRPQNRDRIAELLRQYPNVVSWAPFDGSPLPDCGAPYVESMISVAPLLEYYFARKLQISGLVESAHPDYLYRSPPFIILPLRSPDIIDPLKDEALPVAERLHGARAFFEAQLNESLDQSSEV